MSTPQAKRRRLNDASKTLHKPFKSPFRTPIKPPSSGSPSSDPLDVTTAHAPTQEVSITTTPRPGTVPKPLTPHTNRTTPIASIRIKTSRSFTHEIIQLRSDIQVLTQACALAASTKDADLAMLIDKWRMASRAAAEEVFAKTRDRVNRMGGVGAWREREKEQQEWREKWDQEEMEAERKKYEANMRDGENESVEYDKMADIEQDVEREESGGADDDSFTMDMMLRTLNIDLNLIGFDKEAQRWDG
ncbi:hypothetical protein CC78DRAFT_620756 [Lojkania enalia]|uniref:DNA repair protein Dds20/Mei5 n=1 Tax=Lojkania enalia TaxID=147567 RepID=A0A9P4K440_9PLEO|nr:hypothetical protein CC78DRAFT_620756 [Didymosphaeria enalia]